MGSGNPQNILNMIVGTGQSLSVGTYATPPLIARPPTRRAR